MSEQDKEELRQVLRKHDACVLSEASQQASRRAQDRAMFLRELPQYANPLPTASEFMEGIPHKNDDPMNKGALWNVVQALASTKMHYYAYLQQQMTSATRAASGAAASVLEQRAIAPQDVDVARFQEVFPYVPPGGVVEPLTEATWSSLQKEFNLSTHVEYVQHILDSHDGEARLVGDTGWNRLPAEQASKACFWHYQFAKKAETRRWLYERS